MGAEHRKLGVPGEDELANGRGVSYCATCDAAFFKERETIIVGGGDSAMEEAIFLAKFASKVTIVHRRDEFRASQIMLDRAQGDRQHRAADARTSSRSSCAGEGGLLGSARVRNTETGEERELPMSGAFVAVGHVPQSEIVEGIVETDENGYVVVDGRSTRTRLPGMFAAGDLVDHTYRQAVTAAGIGLPGGAGRRVVPARQPARPHARGARRHRRPRRGAVGAARARAAVALSATRSV